jgi:hypothetical protein
VDGSCVDSTLYKIRQLTRKCVKRRGTAGVQWTVIGRSKNGVASLNYDGPAAASELDGNEVDLSKPSIVCSGVK